MVRGDDITNIIGLKFGRLTVVELIKNKDDKTKYLCICDCGNYIKTTKDKLKSGHTKSCGCLRSELLIKRNKKYNTYDLSGEYGIGYTRKGEEFYFDLEDYDLIKDYCWRTDSEGYICTNNKKDIVYMHRLLLNCTVENIVDHINHKIYDNQKINLRICTYSNNLYNTRINKRNTSGVKGVNFDKRLKKWLARISVDKKQIYLGVFKNKQEAISARKMAEKIYHKEFAYKGSDV